MVRLIRHEAYKQFGSTGFWGMFCVGISLSVFSFLYAAIPLYAAEYREVMPNFDMWLFGLASPSFIQYAFLYIYLPMCICLACNDIFYIERSQAILPALHGRMAMGKLIAAKLLIYALSSLLLVALPLALNWLFCCTMYPSPALALSNPTRQATYLAATFWKGAYLDDTLLYESPWLYAFIRIGITAFWGFYMGALSMLLVLFGAGNRLTVIFAPMIAFYTFSLVFIGLNIPAPFNMLTPAHTSGALKYVMPTVTICAALWLTGLFFARIKENVLL